jgi:hypothetical protein
MKVVLPTRQKVGLPSQLFSPLAVDQSPVFLTPGTDPNSTFAYEWTDTFINVFQALGCMMSRSESFPTQRCTIPDPHKKNIFHCADGTFLVLVMDIRHPHQLAIYTNYKPYIHKGADEVLCGWYSHGKVLTSEWDGIDDADDDVRVIGFKELPCG